MALIAIAGSQGSGKAQPLYSKILTPSGWIRMGQLKVGDQVCTPSGKISVITDIFPQGIKSVYTITTHDGAQSNACGDHLWKCFFARYTKIKGKQTYVKCEEIVDTTFISQYISNNKKRRQKNWGCGISIPVISDNVELSDWFDCEWGLPPYLLGCLLGDGGFTSGGISLTTKDTFILDKCSLQLDEDYKFISYKNDINYRLVGSGKGNKSVYVNKLKDLGLYNKLSHEKFIPDQYKMLATADKWELIRGLMDTDGTVNKTGSSISFTSTSFNLAKDLQSLVWSIGGTASIHIRHPHYKDINGSIINGKTAYEVIVKHNNPKQFFSLPRKIDRCKNEHYQGHKNGSITLKRRIIDVVYKGEEEVQCIMIDHPEHLYITDDYMVTHNTTVINQLRDNGFNIIERKTSRSILEDWNVDLEEINVDPHLAIKFQNEIITRKFEDELSARIDTNIWFTERTFADLFVYQLVSLGNLNEYSPYINDYYKRCIQYQQQYDKVFYLKSGHFSPEHDGIRGSNIHYSRMIDLVMLDITRQMTPISKLNILETPCLEQRLGIIIAQCGLY